MKRVKELILTRAGFAIISNIIAIIVSLLFFRPFWEEGDDVGMALLVEGAYGYHESHILYSNTIYAQNRRPTPEEIHACKPLLAEQFMLVRPKVILLCGSTAYEGFFGTKPVMHDVRGRFIEKNGYFIMTTYHPAYALRNPANKMPIYEDMGKVRQKLTELGAMPPLGSVKD